MPAGEAGGLEIRVLGPVEVAWGGRAVDIGGVKARSLVARLLIDRHIIVSVDRLVDSLWGDHEGPGAEIALRSTISRLRKRLRDAGAPEGLIATRAPGYALEASADVTDAFRLERLVTQGTDRAGPPQAERVHPDHGRGREPVARTGLQRGPRRALRAGRGASTGRAAPVRHRVADRCGADPRAPRGRHRPAGGVDEHAPHARAPVVTTHAGALPLGPPGGGAAGLPGSAHHIGGGVGH